ncbi:uncharacterized protein YhhL (DUF1145 family) [Neorhizobium huautlense]|uniref:Uncharacterized protein YhhL (DUF1145 family) n=1 Tax=Neorhizobium huautlense TaxID=67774 RepID=A0ABT9PZ47_9HYPH|nr:uncharacterized protein YhhL (DUF1145 family) [Neorhizobium huautlense]
MFHLIPIVPWLIVVLRFLLPLPWTLPVKVVAAGILLIASQQLLINRLSSGSVFAPEYPRPLIVLLNALFGAVVLLAIFQLALDIVSLVIGLINQGMPKIPVSVRYGMGLLAFGLSIYGVYQAVRVPPVKNVEIAIKDLPRASKATGSCNSQTFISAGCFQRLGPRKS